VFRKLISGILGQPWFDHQPKKSSMVDHGLTMQPYGENSLKSSPTRTEFNDKNRKSFLAERTNAQEFVWDFSSKKIFWGLEFDS
jgi:hypothetical protein